MDQPIDPTGPAGATSTASEKTALGRKQKAASLLGVASICAGTALLVLTAQMTGPAFGSRLTWGLYGAALVVLGTWVIDRILVSRL